MANVTTGQQEERFRRRLYLPAYRVGDVARYVQTTSQTVAYWRYGGGQLGPALPGSQRREPLSYMELIEVAFVAFFRNLGLSLQRLRGARTYAAQAFNSEFPFVEYRWKSEGYHLLMDFDQFEQSDDFRVVVADRGGQLAWEDLIEDKFAEFNYEMVGEENWALRWHPVGRLSKVVIDPRISFGAPMVEGLPTWVIKGRWKAQEDVDEIVDDFGITRAAVIDGLRFEGIEAAA